MTITKYYRYQLPSWLCKCINIVEKAIIPLVIFQLIRTIIFLTFFEVALLAALIMLFIIFYMGIL